MTIDRKGKNTFLYIYLLYFFFLMPANASTYLTIITENIPPFQLVDKNKKLSGFATEIIKKVLDETPYHYKIKLYPWSRAYNMAQKKENVCIYSIARTIEREHLFQWIDTAILKTNTYFIGLKSNKKIKINKLDDAKKYITAVIKDDITHQLLIKNDFIEFKNYYVINNSDSILKLLSIRKNIDLILMDDLAINYRSKINNIDPSIFKAYFPLINKPLSYHLACSNSTNRKIINTIAQAFKKVHESGEQQKIIDKWLPDKMVIIND